MSMSAKDGLIADAEKLNPLVKFYDPLGLSDQEFWGLSNDQTIGFLRESETKHGRIAMFAFVGYIVHANHITWPWPMQLDGTPFPQVDTAPEAWDAIPDVAKLQIFTVIGFFEFWRESAVDKHYMNGGKIGEFPAFPGHPNLFDPIGLSKGLTDEQREKKLLVEVNNGRAAMLGIFGFLTESKIEGSVPLLQAVGIKHYDGDYMVPLAKSIIPAMGPALLIPAVTFSIFLMSLKKKE